MDEQSWKYNASKLANENGKLQKQLNDLKNSFDKMSRAFSNTYVMMEFYKQQLDAFDKGYDKGIEQAGYDNYK